MAICFRCGKEVFFCSSPEYDICTRCDAKICIDCGTLDLKNGDSMCKTHKLEDAKEVVEDLLISLREHLKRATEEVDIVRTSNRIEALEFMLKEIK